MVQGITQQPTGDQICPYCNQWAVLCICNKGVDMLRSVRDLIDEERTDLGEWETVAELLVGLDRIDREQGPVGMPPYLKRILSAYRRERIK